MTHSPASLIAKFQALHAERERTWEPAKLAANVAQRLALLAAFDPDQAVKAGDPVPPFELEPGRGGTLGREELLAAGPVLLVFFCFAGCPACNVALPHYDRYLRPALEAAGVRLVAVSPHLPEKGLNAIADRHGLGFTVAADRDNALARQFGLTFLPIGNPAVPDGDDNWIGALTGTGTWELPQPAAILIDWDGIVRFADVSPDWMRRTEADTVLSVLDQLAEPAVA